MSEEEDSVLPPFISSVQELMTNFIYCDSQAVCDSIDNLNNVPTKVVPHCLSLRLLHIFGPFDNDTSYQNLVLLANSVHDIDRNVLVNIKLEDNFIEDITFNHIHRTFTLKNFKTIASPQISLAQDNSDCHMLSNPLYDISLIVSKGFNSILKFYGDEFETSNKNMPKQDVYIDDSLSDISLSDLEIVNKVPDRETYLTEDDESNINLPIDNGPSVSSSRPASKTTIEKSSTLKRKLFDTDIENDQSESLIDDFDNENLDPNSREGQEVPLENGNVSLIKDIFDQLSDNVKKDFIVNNFVKKNIHHVDNSNVELTKLSQLVYPTSKLQNYNLVNVIGIIKSIELKKGTGCHLIICDEEAKNCIIQLGFCEIESVLQDPSQPHDEHAKFFANNSNETYPSLLPGKFVCIRTLCLGAKMNNICVHPNQLICIEAHKPYDTIELLSKKRLFKDEFRRLIELVCLSSKQLVENPEVKTVHKSKIISFAGQILANQVLANRVILYLLLPFKTTFNTRNFYGIEYILDQITNLSLSSTREMYKREVVEELLNDKRIITISLWENHMKVLNGTTPLEFLALFNVHIKEDRYYPGFFQFNLHAGNEYGRSCIKVDSNSILGATISKAVNLMLSDTNYNPNLASDFVSNLDEEVRSRLEGVSVSELSENLREHENVDQIEILNLQHRTKKKILGYHEHKEVELLKCENANIKSCQIVETFSEIAADEDSPLFRISARLVDFKFEDKDGIEICTMAALRRNFIHLACSMPDCNFSTSFDSMISQICKKIALHNQEPLPCPQCLSPLLPSLQIELHLQDQCEEQLCIMLTSPESETLVGCSQQQLLYSNPTGSDVCSALKYFLNINCPRRRSSHSRTKKMNKDNTPASNPLYDWIIESRKERHNEFIQANNPKLYNNHLLDDHSDHRRIFYLRGIIKTV